MPDSKPLPGTTTGTTVETGPKPGTTAGQCVN